MHRRFCSFFRWLSLKKEDNFFSINILKPKISSPTNISHEPGVKGVIKARNPKTMQIIPVRIPPTRKIIPNVFLKILFIYRQNFTRQTYGGFTLIVSVVSGGRDKMFMRVFILSVPGSPTLTVYFPCLKTLGLYDEPLMRSM